LALSGGFSKPLFNASVVFWAHASVPAKAKHSSETRNPRLHIKILPILSANLVSQFGGHANFPDEHPGRVFGTPARLGEGA
jgi:hypothetical protein